MVSTETEKSLFLDEKTFKYPCGYYKWALSTTDPKGAGFDRQILPDINWR
jgi:hypothetical protein